MTMGGMPTITQPHTLGVDRHRLSPRICVTIEAHQKQLVDRQSRRERRTQSEIVRLALRLYYEGKDEFGRPKTLKHAK